MPYSLKRGKPIKIRKDWGIISPVTKVKQSGKLYNRKIRGYSELDEAEMKGVLYY